MPLGVGHQQQSQEPTPTLEEWLSSLPDGASKRWMTEEDWEYWTRESQTISERYHLRYEIRDGFITVWIPLPVQSVITDAVSTSWNYHNTQLPVNFRHKFHFSALEYQSSDGGSGKVGDVEIRRFGEKFPRIMFEVGLSKTRERLLNDVCRWFQLSGGQCKTVVLVKIEEAREKKTETEDSGQEEEEDSGQEEGEGEDLEEEPVEKAGEEETGEKAEEKIEGTNFGPYHSDGKLLVGKCSAYIERWDYTAKFAERLTEAKTGGPGHQSNDFIQLTPRGPNPDPRSTMKISLGGNSPKRRYFELSLKECRKQIKYGMRLSALYRLRHQKKTRDVEHQPGEGSTN